MTCQKCDHRRDCKHQCMNLPEGKKCGDCRHYNYCKMLFGANKENSRCDFEPIRFAEIAEVQE